MFQWEKNIIAYMKKNILWFGAGVMLLVSLYVRYSFWSLGNSDIVLMNSWIEAARTGGIPAMFDKMDYNALYIYLFYILSQLPLPLTTPGLLKLVFVGFEYLCIGACVLLVYRLSMPERRDRNAFITFTLLSLSPVMVLNAAGWGQCDAMYTLFVVLMLLMLLKDRPVWALVMFGLALSLKLQAIFVLPALLLYWFVQTKKSTLYLLLVPIILWVTALPLTLFGASPFFGFTAYGAQAGSQLFWTSKNYPGFYALFGAILDPFQFEDHTHLYMFMKYGMGLCLGALVSMYTLLVKRKALLEKQNLVLLFAWTALTCVFFLPHMHERYGMMGEVLLLCYAVLQNKAKYYLLWVAATLVTVFAYSDFIFIEQIRPQQIGSYINLAILGVLTAKLLNTDKLRTQTP